MDSVRKIAEKKPNLLKQVNQLPDSPGVYIYRDTDGVVLYVGKAVSLKKRVRQYFTRDDAVGPKTVLLVRQVEQLETIQTASEFDAMLLEAKLIYSYQPKYNVIAKDDKSPLYIRITLSETLPRVLFVRKPRTPTYGVSTEGQDVLFGPFQSGRNARQLMRTIRRIAPYCTQKKRTGKPCFYTHIGLCRPCPSGITGIADPELRKKETAAYRRNMFRIRDILSGKSATVMRQLESDMARMAEEQRFEEAVTVRNQLQSLYEVISERVDPMMYVRDEGSVESMADSELSALEAALQLYYPNIRGLIRIECIDISNTLGTYATGSLVVLTRGIADTSEYKRFRIRRKNAPNDVAMIAEVIRRRFSHPEWPMPDLLVVDGGKGQVRGAYDMFEKMKIGIPLIGLAKRREEIIIPQGRSFAVIRLPMTDPAVHVLQRIRDEAHRFAISYHRLLRSRALKNPDTL